MRILLNCRSWQIVWRWFGCRKTFTVDFFLDSEPASGRSTLNRSFHSQVQQCRLEFVHHLSTSIFNRFHLVASALQSRTMQPWCKRVKTWKVYWVVLLQYPHLCDSTNGSIIPFCFLAKYPLHVSFLHMYPILCALFYPQNLHPLFFLLFLYPTFSCPTFLYPTFYFGPSDRLPLPSHSLDCFLLAHTHTLNTPYCLIHASHYQQYFPWTT